MRNYNQKGKIRIAADGSGEMPDINLKHVMSQKLKLRRFRDDFD